MFELITLDLIDVPAAPREYAFRIGDENFSGWTNGWRLWTKYDPSWRKKGSPSSIATNCRMVYGARTSQMTVSGGDWKEIIEGHTTKEWPEETDAKTRRWAMEFFCEPPEAPLPTVSRIGVENPALM